MTLPTARQQILLNNWKHQSWHRPSARIKIVFYKPIESSTGKLVYLKMVYFGAITSTKLQFENETQTRLH